MRDQTIGDWLEDLASAAPAPGGGAAAAMNAATGAALVSMVCNLTIGKPKYAEHELLMTDVLARATALRIEALRLAEADAEVFTAVMDAYKLPKDTDEAKLDRKNAIQQALGAAAAVPLSIAAVAAEVIMLAGRITDGANPNVLSDVAVAADSARAGLRSAAINVEINRASITDEETSQALAEALERHNSALAHADTVVATVTERIKR